MSDVLILTKRVNELTPQDRFKFLTTDPMYKVKELKNGRLIFAPVTDNGAYKDISSDSKQIIYFYDNK